MTHQLNIQDYLLVTSLLQLFLEMCVGVGFIIRNAEEGVTV